MTIRTRKLVGTILLIVYIAAYSLLAMFAAIILQVNASKLVEIVYYIVAGTVWAIPAALLIRWMARPDAPG